MISLDGYPLDIGMGWRTLIDMATTVLTIMTLILAIVGLYMLGVRMIFLIADWMG